MDSLVGPLAPVTLDLIWRKLDISVAALAVFIATGEVGRPPGIALATGNTVRAFISVGFCFERESEDHQAGAVRDSLPDLWLSPAVFLTRRGSAR